MVSCDLRGVVVEDQFFSFEKDICDVRHNDLQLSLARRHVLSLESCNV